MDPTFSEGLINVTTNGNVEQEDIIELAKAYTMYKIGKLSL